jgi:acyl carrier protein
MYILNYQLGLCPIGVPGELYIGGDGAASGYINNIEQTHCSFIRHNQLGRIYRTGDYGVFHREGYIEFLGRKDFQVKIRGYRVELGEIESCLLEHQAIKTAVVVDGKNPQNKKYLAAYIVPDREFPVAELRTFLTKKIPGYMIPSFFINMEQIPLTPNGKIDRKALPKPDGGLDERAEYIAPTSDLEMRLSDIWQEILNVETIGITSDFFELGGDSLKATNLSSRILKEFKTKIGIGDFFENPTIEGLAGVICKTKASNDMEVVPADAQDHLSIKPVPRKGPLLMSFAQERMWFLAQAQEEGGAFNISAALRITGKLNTAVMKQSLNEIIRRHESLRTTFTAEEGRLVQVIKPAWSIQPEEVDLQRLLKIEQSKKVRRLAAEEARKPFDLAQGPLLRVTLLKLDQVEHVILLTMHHIIGDAWSMRIFIREMSVLYRAYLKGEPPPLPELPIQYADYAHWQLQWLSGDNLEKQVDYWNHQLNGSPLGLNLRTDRPRTSPQAFRSSAQYFEVNLPLTRKIKLLSQQQEVSLYMTLLAAFTTLLFRYTRQEDIVVGSFIANRHYREIESLIGFFVNTIVLRTDLSGNPGFRELLNRVRKITLDAYKYQDVPFGKVMEAVLPKHYPGSLFQVMFLMNNVPEERFHLPGLFIEPLNIEGAPEVMNNDLVLAMEETNKGLLGSLAYNANLFMPATIRRMIDHFQTLLKEIVTDSKRCISELPLMTKVEKRR